MPLEATLLRGSIEFYLESTKKGIDPVSVTLKELTNEQVRKVDSILENIEEWTDALSVDRTAYYFDGKVIFSTQELALFFSYEHDILYYDHYFAVVSGKEIHYIRDIMNGD